MLQKSDKFAQKYKINKNKIVFLSRNHILSLCKCWINLQLLLLRTWMMQPAAPLHARIAL